MNEERVRKGFNSLSAYYDLLATAFFGRSLFKAQTYFIGSLDDCRSILILGGGTGRIMLPLLCEQSARQIVYVDLADKMIEKAKKRINRSFPGHEMNIRYIRGSYSDIPGSMMFDGIITPFFLDCFSDDELAVMFGKLSLHLSPEAKWLMTDFNIPEKPRYMRYVSATIVKGLYLFFKLAAGLEAGRLADFVRCFEDHGLNNTAKRYFSGGLLVSGIYQKP